MKALFTLITITCIVNLSYAQTFFSSQVEQRPCLQNPSQTINQFVEWDIYQTVDGTADGEIDSSSCFDLLTSDNWPNTFLNLSGFDKSRPLILRSRIDSLEQYRLPPNYYVQVEANPNVDVPVNNNASTELSTQLHITSTIPSEDNNSLIERKDILYPNTNNGGIYSCLVTQKFEEGQYLKEIKYQINLEELDNQDIDSVGIRPFVNFYYLDVLPTIEEITISESDYNSAQDQYEFDLSQTNEFWNAIIIAHTLDGHPSPSNVDYVDVNLEENKAESQEIILNQGDPYFTILYQDYARFRAGLIEGSDSIRHNLQLHIDSSMMCLGVFIELVIDPSVDLYITGNGGIDFNTLNSCVLALGSSTIHIDNEYSLFGDNGNGMIALRQDGSIHIHSGTDLDIGARILHNNDNPDTRPSIIIENEASLYFTKFADILNDQPEDLSIDVYLHDGGTIHYSNLSYEDQQKLNIIRVQEDNITEQDNISIHPNPSTSLSKITSSQIINSLMVFDQMGRLIYEADQINKKEYQLNTAQYDQGVYCIRVNTKSNIISSKFIKG